MSKSKIIVGSFVKVNDQFIEIAKVKNLNTGNVKLSNSESFTVTDETEILTAEEMAAKLAGTTEAETVVDEVVVTETVVDETVVDDETATRALTPEELVPVLEQENNELRVKLSEKSAEHASLQKMYFELESKYITTLGEKMKLQTQQPAAMVIKKSEPAMATITLTASDIL